MEFEWSEAKNEQNIRKHGLDFADGQKLFSGQFPFLVAPDEYEEVAEERWRGIGVIQGRLVVVILFERPPNVIRFISLRERTRRSKRRMKRQSKTNWDKVDALRDAEIDYSDNPRLTSAFFEKAVRWPGNKELISLRLDPDVLTFFRKQGKGYQTTINLLLRRYMEAQRTAPPPASTPKRPLRARSLDGRKKTPKVSR